MSKDCPVSDRDVRMWFMTTDLTRARDAFRVVEGILQTREQFQPKRKPRSDAGAKRKPRREPPPFDRSREDMREPADPEQEAADVMFDLKELGK